MPATSITVPAREPVADVDGRPFGTLREVWRARSSPATWGLVRLSLGRHRLVPLAHPRLDRALRSTATAAQVRDAPAVRTTARFDGAAEARLRAHYNRPDRPRPRLSMAMLGGLVAAQVAYGLEPRGPRATRAVLGLALATSAVEATQARGRRGALVTGLAGAVGLAGELVGTATGKPFGRYAYSEKLGPAVRHVPLLVPAAWGAMARPAWVAAGWVSRDARLRVPAAAAALTAWDVYLDPRMVREGYWRWARRGRYQGIPASNYAGWFATGLAIFALTAVVDPAQASPEDDLALGLYGWTWIGEAFANAVLWRRPAPALAGAAAMGAVAIPALRRRLS